MLARSRSLRPKRKRRRLRAGAVGLLALLMVLGGGVALYLRSSLPQTSGRLVVPGLHAEIRIDRDTDGVPLITARDDEDAAFGLGFVHAQDRLFQMELQRRYGAGRLAEIFGPEAAANDRQMRVLGLYRAAEAEIPFLSAEVRSGLEAYAAGVNAFLATHRGALPPEFLLLRFSPEPWRPADSLVWGKLMAVRLGGNYRGELLRARMARTIPPADLAVLYPEYPKDAPTTLSAMLPVYRRLALDRLYEALPPIVGPSYASNNWVVDGRHSSSGKPLLANDPHLDFGAPGFWYLARLKTPQHDIAGGTAAGSPFILVGHNERIAWGLTTTTADVEDLFVERIDADDPGRYLTPQGSAPFVSRSETILVRGEAPVELTIRTTRNGPVLSDVLPAGAADPGYVLALAATFTIPEDRSAEALWELNRATDWQGFHEALRNFVGPMQNIVYADVDGTIGFVAPGLVPIRHSGEGWLPAPGWTGEYDWVGFIPFEALPSGVDPPSGHFISANNRIVPAGYPYFVSRDWDLPNRVERIEALLAATPVQTPAASAAIEADTLSLMAQRLVPLMTRMTPADDGSREALLRLGRWDFRMDRDKVEPLLFTAWLRELSRAVLSDRFGDAVSGYWDLKPRVMEAILTEHQDWCDDPKQPGKKGCAVRLANSLATALAQLRQTYGPDMAQWQWGRAHVAVFANPLSGHFADLLRRWRDFDWLVPGRSPAVATLILGPQQ